MRLLTIHAAKGLEFPIVALANLSSRGIGTVPPIPNAEEHRLDLREVQEALVSGAPERFFVPPYVGHRGWIGLRLDLPNVDWDQVFGVIEDAQTCVVDR